MKKFIPNRGFTLIELMIVLAVAAILVAVAIPSFRQTIMNNRMASTANGIVGAISFARSEAVKRGGEVRLEQLNGGWGNGIVVWVDSDGDNARDDGEEIRLWSAMDGKSTLSSTQNAFTFNALGRVDNGDKLTLCDSRTGEIGREILLLTSGAVSIKNTTCS